MQSDITYITEVKLRKSKNVKRHPTINVKVQESFIMHR